MFDQALFDQIVFDGEITPTLPSTGRTMKPMKFWSILGIIFLKGLEIIKNFLT